MPKIGFGSGSLLTYEKTLIFFPISKSIKFPYLAQLIYFPKLDFEADPLIKKMCFFDFKSKATKFPYITPFNILPKIGFQSGPLMTNEKP